MTDSLKSLSILIPAYNDADTIEQVVVEAHKEAISASKLFEIIVLNDGSQDQTGKILTSLQKRYRQLRLITHEVNQGYGMAIKDLYFAGRYEWLFTCPGDNQIPPRELRKLLVSKDKADMIIGWRTNRNDPPARLRQSFVYNTLLKLLYNIKLHDINSVRLMKTKIIQNVNISTFSAFVDAELTIDAIRAGYKVIEVPIAHRARVGEQGAGGGKLRTILPVIKEMILYKFLNSNF